MLHGVHASEQNPVQHFEDVTEHQRNPNRFCLLNFAGREVFFMIRCCSCCYSIMHFTNGVVALIKTYKPRNGKSDLVIHISEIDRSIIVASAS